MGMAFPLILVADGRVGRRFAIIISKKSVRCSRITYKYFTHYLIIVILMSKLSAMKGVFKTLFWLVREEWAVMEHRLLKIVFGTISFVLMALFWLYFLRGFGI